MKRSIAIFMVLTSLLQAMDDTHSALVEKNSDITLPNNLASAIASHDITKVNSLLHTLEVSDPKTFNALLSGPLQDAAQEALKKPHRSLAKIAQITTSGIAGGVLIASAILYALSQTQVHPEEQKRYDLCSALVKYYAGDCRRGTFPYIEGVPGSDLCHLKQCYPPVFSLTECLEKTGACGPKPTAHTDLTSIGFGAATTEIGIFLALSATKRLWDYIKGKSQQQNAEVVLSHIELMAAANKNSSTNF